jgi:hypothetical protein
MPWVGFEWAKTVHASDRAATLIGHEFEYIMKLLLSLSLFSNFWEQMSVVPTFREGNNALVITYRLITIFNIFFNIVESITHDKFSFYFHTSAWFY